MSKKSKWSEYSSIEKVQEFINSNNISSKIDFKNKYQSLYTRARLNNWLDNLKFKIIKRNDLSKFDNIDSIRVLKSYIYTSEKELLAEIERIKSL